MGAGGREFESLYPDQSNQNLKIILEKYSRFFGPLSFCGPDFLRAAYGPPEIRRFATRFAVPIMLKEKGTFRDGKSEGEWVLYFDNGQWRENNLQKRRQNLRLKLHAPNANVLNYRIARRLNVIPEGIAALPCIPR